MFAVSTDGGQTWKVQHPAGLPNAALQAFAVDPANSTELLRRARRAGSSTARPTARSRSSSSSPKLGIPPWAVAIMKGGQFAGGDMDTGPYLELERQDLEEDDLHRLARHARWSMEYAVDADRHDEGADDELRDRDLDRQRQDLAHGAQVDDDVRADRLLGLASPDVAYAIGFDSSIWRSDDGGKSWTQVG